MAPVFVFILEPSTALKFVGIFVSGILCEGMFELIRITWDPRKEGRVG